MKMENDEKSEDELACRFKIDIRNLTNFDSRAWKVSIIYTLMGCFWPRYIMFELKMTRFVVWKMTRGIWQIFTIVHESIKIGTFIGPFNTK